MSVIAIRGSVAGSGLACRVEFWLEVDGQPIVGASLSVVSVAEVVANGASLAFVETSNTTDSDGYMRVYGTISSPGVNRHVKARVQCTYSTVVYKGFVQGVVLGVS